MTVKQLFDNALMLLPAEPGTDQTLYKFAVSWVNQTLREALAFENSFRLSRGEPELAAAPILGALGDEIPFNSMLPAAMVYNVASLLCKDEDDAYWATEYRARFIVLCSDCAAALPGGVADLYWGAGE